MYKAKVFVKLKESVLDPQGKAIMNALHSLEFDKVKNVRTGKFFILEINVDSEQEASSYIEKICGKLLVNPVIETYTYEIEKL